MTVVTIVVRIGLFFSLKLKNGQTSSPPKNMHHISVETLSGMRLLASVSSRLSTSAVTPNATAPMSPPQRRARIVRTPRGGKGSPSLVPSVSPSLATASVAASPGSVASQSASASASRVSGAVEASSPESAVPGWLLGSVSG